MCKLCFLLAFVVLGRCKGPAPPKKIAPQHYHRWLPCYSSEIGYLHLNAKVFVSHCKRLTDPDIYAKISFALEKARVVYEFSFGIKLHFEVIQLCEHVLT
ncbi:hypothetical protein MHBO_000117 [Bonamia ostreae]|uniref:Secreted protein n=1 Tax=Bonamia ostreae TaxID=126728 RepID=A0ABV2AEE7_9EUKA